ncbi:MAG: U32 family peptidase [Clostridia bacterium]|nr:U32 family peptidase [Clostridia bacterium]
MEILAPAGDFEAARSAVHNGADAIYVGGRILNARRAAKGFDGEELKELVRYCRLRKVKVYVTVNTLTREDELPALLELTREIAEAGADGAIVSDLGVARVLQSVCPTLPLHASTQMNIHTASGVRFLEKLGFKRVVLARELSLREIREICAATSMEIEVFGHGALCMCYSGNCYLSAVIGQKSGNRGLCAQPCRLPYENGQYPLSLKDLCTLEHLKELKDAGVTSLKIEGRLKSPEYVGSVTAAYRKALEGIAPTTEDITRLAHIFSRDGFTRGYLTEQTGPAMFGTKTKTAYADYKEAVKAVSKTLEEGYEPKRRKVSFRLFMREELCKLTVSCEDFKTDIIGPPPQPALKKEVTEEDALRNLSKVGGTPFELVECTALVRHDLFYPASAFNALRREALAAVEQHFAPKPHDFYDLLPETAPSAEQADKPWLEGWFWSPEKALPKPDPRLKRYWLNGKEPEPCRPLAGDPRAGIFFPAVTEEQELLEMGRAFFEMGFRQALVRNPGQIAPLKELGFSVHGDFSFNAANSQALTVLKEELESITLSYELTLAQIRRLPKPMTSGIIVYGRLPLMVTKNCFIRNFTSCKKGKGAALTDRTGRVSPIACDYGCRNVLFNSSPLYLADRSREWKEADVSFGRLLFTDETPAQISRIVDEYAMERGLPPADHTRGLYYRGVL